VRNALSHDYGKELAEETLPLIPKFIEDALHIIERYNTDWTHSSQGQIDSIGVGLKS
jgi:hypothetical protein